MRLIDADALKKEVESIMSETMDMSFQIYAQGFCTTIDNAPTIDACPYYHHEPTGEPFCEKDDRRHGEWLELNDPDATLENYYVCNQCGRMSNYNSNFCPNCGAKMDGERSEE